MSSIQRTSEAALRWLFLIAVAWVAAYATSQIVAASTPYGGLVFLAVCAILLRTGLLPHGFFLAARWASGTREPLTESETEEALFQQFLEIRRLPVAHGDPDDEL